MGRRRTCYTEAVLDVEKTMEFILGQQAKFFAALEESRRDMRDRDATMRSFVETIARQQLELTEHVNYFQREISAAVLAIAEQQKLLAEEQRRLAEQQALLAEAQRHTEERLNALIVVVDGIVRRPPQQ